MRAATARLVLRFRLRVCQERVYGPDIRLSIKSNLDPILTLFRRCPYVRLRYTLSRHPAITDLEHGTTRLRTPVARRGS
jgi:hypothetical protein